MVLSAFLETFSLCACLQYDTKYIKFKFLSSFDGQEIGARYQESRSENIMVHLAVSRQAGLISIFGMALDVLKRSSTYRLDVQTKLVCISGCASLDDPRMVYKCLSEDLLDLGLSL